MLAFTAQVDFLQKAFVVNKKRITNEPELIAQLARQFSDFIKQHYSERRVLGSDRDIQKYLLKPLKKKEFRNN